MNHRLLMAALAAATLLAGHQASAGWRRQTTVTTPRGTYDSTYYGSCAAGTCSRSGTITGPYGGTAYRSGSVTRTAPGQFSSSGSFTGPNGNSVTRSGSTSCAGGTCSHTGTVTGPYGGTVTSSGSVSAVP